MKAKGAGSPPSWWSRNWPFLGESDPDEFPIQMKRHSLDFLREKAHLRFRTNTFGAVFRVRHVLQYMGAQFFPRARVLQLHTPIITGSDAEGRARCSASTLDVENPPRAEDGSVDVSQDFFGKEST